MGISRKDLFFEGLEITVQDDVVSMIGNIDSRNPGDFLKVFFSDLNREIVSNKLKKMTVDLTRLEFLNSSGIKQFVDWVMALDDLDETDRYEIEIVINPEYMWQESSVSSLLYLNPRYIKKKLWQGN